MAEENFWQNDAYATAASAQKNFKQPPQPSAGPSPDPNSLDAPASPPRGQAAQAAFTKIAAARAMRKQINHVHDLYDRYMSADGIAGLREYNPLSKRNQEFDGAVAAVPLLARQAFRVAGSGSDSDKELKLITDALPSRWSFDATNNERFRTLDSVVGDMIGNNAGLAGYSASQAAALRRENLYAPGGRRTLPTPPPSVRRPSQSRVVVDINGNIVK